MSSNMSINSSGVYPVGPISDQSNRSSEAPVIPIQTAKDLQVAEKQGIKLSVSDEQLIKAIDRAVKALQGPNTECEVSIHQKTKQLVIKVIDKDNGKLIREIPPEKTLDMVAKMMEIAGLLIDERV